ncbi:MAG TPA: 2OG-Fe(II) oxygenase [Novosphingobium sp.]|nr:2OG-Fe(II) oxygenase [Novosphingobium sp.]
MSDRRFPPLPPLGSIAPSFHAPALAGNPRYAFDTVAGRCVLMLFHGSAGSPQGRAAFEVLARHRALFDDRQACFFGVTADPEDERQGRIAQVLPGIRHFLDYGAALSESFGLAARNGERIEVRPAWLVLDRMLRIKGWLPVERGEEAITLLRQTIAAEDQQAFAPVLVVPDVLEADLCRRLIAHYESRGGEESGFMRAAAGKTVGLGDHSHKRRFDCQIDDESLRRAIDAAVFQRLVPMIARAFQFAATRIERHIVACYDSDGGGYFNPHRDNTTPGTAHRRFAVTLNLNTEDYEGGELAFPEFGPRLYKPATGSALVFSCSLLHRALPVTRGRRYAVLPFLYDEAGARVREANAATIVS